MDLTLILSQIDAQIEQLQKAKALLQDAAAPRRVGRPPKNSTPTTTTARKRKPLSASARARISAAQKARWAEQRKADKKAK